MKGLVSVFACDNMISEIPETIQNMSGLRDISLGDNNITDVPDCIWDIESLTNIFLLGNPIDPEEFDIIRQKVRLLATK